MRRLIYEDVGRRVAALRRERGLTQERLAEVAVIASSYLARIEAGKRKPTLDVLHAIALGLGVPVWRLLADDRMTADERAARVSHRDLADALDGLGPEDLRLLATIARRLGRAASPGRARGGTAPKRRPR